MLPVPEAETTLVNAAGVPPLQIKGLGVVIRPEVVKAFSTKVIESVALQPATPGAFTITLITSPSVNKGT